MIGSSSRLDGEHARPDEVGLATMAYPTVAERSEGARGVSPARRRRWALWALALAMCGGPSAHAAPRPGIPVPTFRVEDLDGRVHTERDLMRTWSVVVAITDKDSGPAVHAWFERGLLGMPSSVQVVSMAALNIIPLVPTAAIVGAARADAPRHRWRTIWVSRDGSLNRALDLGDGEDPWVFVVNPDGRVVEVVHAPADELGMARVRRALGLTA